MIMNYSLLLSQQRLCESEFIFEEFPMTKKELNVMIMEEKRHLQSLKR